jgi:hypothetical protein
MLLPILNSVNEWLCDGNEEGRPILYLIATDIIWLPQNVQIALVLTVGNNQHQCFWIDRDTKQGTEIWNNNLIKHTI